MGFNFQDQSLFEATFRRCQFLSEDQARSFVENGFVVIKNAFPKEVAAKVCERSWEELETEQGIKQGVRDSWRNHRNGYIRTQGKGFRVRLLDEAPDARQAQLDVLGGKERLAGGGEEMSFPGSIIANFGVEGDPPWEPPQPQQNGWHKDGWHFRHFMDSPEQGLLTVPIYTEILPRSGGTFLATDSIGPVARLLADQTDGFHADGTQGSGYLIPYLLDQCREFVELTGDPGDLAILHPYMLHRRTVNPTDRTRFIANIAIVLNEPMKFARTSNETYSLTELAVLHALGKDSWEFQATEPRQAYIPGPFRPEEDRKVQRVELRKEMAVMAQRGVLTPTWAPDHGYMTNNPPTVG